MSIRCARKNSADDSLRSYYCDLTIRRLIAMRRHEEGWQAAQEFGLTIANAAPDQPDRVLVPCCLAYLAHGVDLAAITPLLADALAHRTAQGNRFGQLHMLVLTAWQELQLLGEQAAARTLDQAAHLARETGYIRVLLDVPDLASIVRKLDLCVESAPLREPGERSADSGDNVLTQQELKVLELLARDHTYQQIAEELVISINTVRTHVRHIYRKLGVRSRDQAIASAWSDGLLATE